MRVAVGYACTRPRGRSSYRSPTGSAATARSCWRRSRRPPRQRRRSNSERTMLQLNNVEVVYDRTILVLRGVSLEVPTGQIVALLGSNGAGKSTTLKTISGILRPQRGEVTAGTVEVDGLRIEHWEPADIVKRGDGQGMAGRGGCGHLTSQEELIAGAH